MRESFYNFWVHSGDAAYVYNAITGALLRIPAKDYDLLMAGAPGDDWGKCSLRTLAHLVEGMMLVPDAADEVSVLRQRYQATSSDRSDLSLTIVTSLSCNFDCPYCFENKRRSILDSVTRGHILDLLDQQIAEGIKGLLVEWFGGEPLIARRALLSLSDEFIKRCDQHGIQYRASIVTNGFLLNESTCRELQERRVLHAQVGLDGPPHIHDRMRPGRGGKKTFWKIIENLHSAIQHFSVSLRVNLDRSNLRYAKELLQILANEGFCGKLNVYPGQIVETHGAAVSRLPTHERLCLNREEFADAEHEFLVVARQYGLASPALPAPIGAPCLAARENELVIGSDGELYKCWASVGNAVEIVGDIEDSRPLERCKPVDYSPFEDPQCLRCRALPVCMGGCAHHATADADQRDNRCTTFRRNYHEQILAFVEDPSRGSPRERDQPGSSLRLPEVEGVLGSIRLR